jgi:hypothetical protein
MKLKFLLRDEPPPTPLGRKVLAVTGVGVVMELTAIFVFVLLGIDLHAFWSLLASWALALPPVIFYAREERPLFFLTGVAMVGASFCALLTQSLWILFTTYALLLILLPGGFWYLRRWSN